MVQNCLQISSLLGLFFHSGGVAPTNYLLCNGAAVSRTTYAKLFSVIGTTYGSGDGSTTFNVPNMSNIVTSVNTNVPVKGNGMTLGLTNGTSYGGLESTSTLFAENNGYGQPVSTNRTSGSTFSGNIGVTTDSSKSGIVGTVTRTVASCKFIIKC